MNPAQRVAGRFLVALQRTKDIEDAVDHYWQSYVDDEDGTVCFEAQARRMTTEEVRRWDDYSSWGEFEQGELASLPPDEARDELAGFRGAAWADRALGWLKRKKIPPLILIDGEAGECLGDGRGRMNFAMAFAIPVLDVIVLVEKPGGNLCFTFRGGRIER